MMNETTKKDFEKFKEYCLNWQRELGLDDWHIYFYHKPLKGVFANSQCGIKDRCVAINLATKWEDREVNDEELTSCALHEVLHIVTAPLYQEGVARYADEFSLEATEHSIVTRLTNVLLRLAKVA